MKTPETLRSHDHLTSVGEECTHHIHTSPAICYNAGDFVTEVYIEKTDYCRWSPYLNAGVFYYARSHRGCAGLDNICGSPVIWRIHHLWRHANREIGFNSVIYLNIVTL